jgi:hypothetical protein
MTRSFLVTDSAIMWLIRYICYFIFVELVFAYHNNCVTKKYYYVRVCDSPFFIAITVSTYVCDVRNVTGKQNQHNGQKKKCKRTNINLQNMHITKDRVIRTQLKTRSELRCPGRVWNSDYPFGMLNPVLIKPAYPHHASLKCLCQARLVYGQVYVCYGNQEWTQVPRKGVQRIRSLWKWLDHFVFQ